MTEEQYLREQIALIQREYERAVKPYIDQLVRLENLKPIPPVLFSGPQAEALRLHWEFNLKVPMIGGAA